MVCIVSLKLNILKKLLDKILSMIASDYLKFNLNQQNKTKRCQYQLKPFKQETFVQLKKGSMVYFKEAFIFFVLKV